MRSKHFKILVTSKINENAKKLPITHYIFFKIILMKIKQTLWLI